MYKLSCPYCGRVDYQSFWPGRDCGVIKCPDCKHMRRLIYLTDSEYREERGI